MKLGHHTKVSGPDGTHIAFSGGRTSGFMLNRIIRSFSGQLPEDVVPIFCNTGKEHPGTLDFVQECSVRWNVPIVWLEFRSRAKNGIAVVTYETASRNGEPFEALIRTKQRLPNVVSRFCTQWLKILTSHRYCVNVLGWKEYDSAIGLRADEPHRVAKLQPNDELTPGEWPFAPLAQDGVTLADVAAFWKAQPFDLNIPEGQGNCDWCFLKGFGQRAQVYRNSPEVADWWIAQERWVSQKTQQDARFTKGMSLPMLIERATELTLFDDERFPECRCTD